MASSQEKRISKRLQQTTLLEQASQSFRKNQPSQRRMVIEGFLKGSQESDLKPESLGAITTVRRTHNTSLGEPRQLTDSDEEKPVRRLKRQRTRVLESDSDTVHIVAPRKRLRKIPKTVLSDNDDAPQYATRSQTHGSLAAAKLSDEDILDEVEPERILTSRLRTRSKKSSFQQNLEKLQRRKQGKKSWSSSEDEDVVGSDYIRGAKPFSDRDILSDEESDEDNNSDNFIVEDDGSVVALLPTQFSMETHQDLAHQFKKIFQFFVHIAVRPAKDRHDYMAMQIKEEEYFAVPLQVTRRKISGLRDSLVASSVWLPQFKKNLARFPDLDLVSLDFTVPSCDACRLGGRMSKLIGRLSGSPYERVGFEPLDKHINSDSDDFESTVEYHLGRFCAKRTRVYHEFLHWEYSLFKCILREVDNLHTSGYSKGFFRVAFAEGKQPPDDLGDADAICEWLDERRVIDMEWQKVKVMMESSRHLDVASKKELEDD